jgi:transposase-like protein
LPEARFLERTESWPTSRYSQEVRERAVRMVFEHRGEYDSEWEAIHSA